jgi:hypothetical protein
MPVVLRNILAIIAGAILGSIVNMGLIMMGGSVIEPPAGTDVTTAEGLKSSMHLFEPRHFIFPFLAHALGTFVGAYIAARIAGSRKMLMALIVGILFLIGGIMNVFMLPSPLWFTLLDLIVAYLPMAYIAGKIANR